MTYLYIFLQSNLLEVPFYIWLLSRSLSKRSLKENESLPIWYRGLGFVTFMNSVTHPVVFFFIMNMKMTYLQNILLAEAFAIVTETLIIGLILKPGWLRAFFASLLANLVSWQLGPMLTYLFFA